MCVPFGGERQGQNFPLSMIYLPCNVRLGKSPFCTCWIIGPLALAQKKSANKIHPLTCLGEEWMRRGLRKGVKSTIEVFFRNRLHAGLFMRLLSTRRPRGLNARVAPLHIDKVGGKLVSNNLHYNNRYYTYQYRKSCIQFLLTRQTFFYCVE